jgi:hypothetical protein
MGETKLTKEEVLFCELYANGDAPFSGNATKCYAEAFNSPPGNISSKALRLLSKPEIQEYLEELDKLTYEEAKYMKKFLTKNLVSIVEECSTQTFCNKKGQTISPAPLRSVAVSASKALMEMYPVKEAQKLSIDGGGDGGITFNVIMPEPLKKEDK